MHKVPLTPELPPRNFPRLSLTCLPLTPFIDGVTRFQSVSASKFLLQPPVILMFSLSLQSGPASISRILALVSSASLAAITHPLVPPPLNLFNRHQLHRAHHVPYYIVVFALRHVGEDSAGKFVQPRSGSDLESAKKGAVLIYNR